jgi:hypothetical protein
MKNKSEQLFESFLTTNNMQFEKIEENTSPRPDYLVSVDDVKIIFELKELAGDKNFGVVHSRTVGEHVRDRINSARKQIQYGADQGIPSVLIIYNKLDTLQTFGTEDMDFIAAMYGEYTKLIDRDTKQSLGWFNGRNQSLRESKNTQFSAVRSIV